MLLSQNVEDEPLLLAHVPNDGLDAASRHHPLFSRLIAFPLPSGLSKSFPLDNSLFDSWLAQSVQITADDMLSQWALADQHGDKSGSLLSDQVESEQRSLVQSLRKNVWTRASDLEEDCVRSRHVKQSKAPSPLYLNPQKEKDVGLVLMNHHNNNNV